jgi:serpin B
LAHAGRARAAETGAGADQKAVVEGNGQFGFDLYRQLRSTAGNVFFSPYSVSQALAMTSAGARGVTADEMARTLRLSLDPRRLHPAFAGLMRDMNRAERSRQCELAVANALWSQTGYPFVEQFQQIAKTDHAAALEEVDFAGAPESARRTINARVEKQTRDKIKELLGDGFVRRDTVLVLTNAIYFKGSWLHPFREDVTAIEEFKGGPKGVAQRVPLMRQQATYRYLDDGAFQALDVPFEANELSMLAFLPRKIDGLADFEQRLTMARLSDWIARMSPQEVNVAMPRFKATASYSLARSLRDLGMRRAFSSDADFSRMVAVERVSLSSVVHKAYVDVNEKGAEAAAATGIGVVPVMAQFPPVPVFRADHPFFFLIRDNGTGSLLFAGRLSDPQAA